MTGRRRDFIIAICVTVLDAVVVWECGPTIWHAFGPVPWLRDALVLLVGIGCFTLADIWSRTVPSAMQRTPGSQSVEGATTISAGLPEGADV